MPLVRGTTTRWRCGGGAVCGVIVAALAMGCIGNPAQAAEPTAEPIADTEIAALRQDLAEGVRSSSSIDVRRACKRVIRRAAALVEASPQAPNRFAALAVQFDAQKRLMALEATLENRNAIFETCRALGAAPDEYAESRFEADMILSEQQLAEAEATVAERIAALQKTLARYRGTSAEWKSLMIGSLVATKLVDLDVEQQIYNTMAERFGGNHDAIQFRRTKHRGGQFEAVFKGRYTTADGEVIVFPNDRLGHQYLIYFWSTKTPRIAMHLRAIKQAQDKARSTQPGGLTVYSFNVDELPDAGQKQLRDLGIDWPAMHLPGGRNSSTYRAYATMDPHAVLVNAQGHVHLTSTPPQFGVQGDPRVPSKTVGSWDLDQSIARLDSGRYTAQLRYLFIGDFLIARPPAAGGVPAEVSRAITACFTPAPFYYRLTKTEALANYRKAERLCAAAINAHADANNLWAVRNRRIVALLGMANLTGDAKHLDRAVEQANVVLAMDPPRGADVVAQYCLAVQAMRRDGVDPEKVIAAYLEQVGGDDAPAAAHAGAVVLALQTNARTPYAAYRARLLDRHRDASELMPVIAFVRDKHHAYRNFQATPGGLGNARPQKYAFRDMVSGLAEPRDTDRGLKFTLNRLAGGTFRVPDDAGGEMLGIVFIEPPADSAAHEALMKRVDAFVAGYTKRGVKVIVACFADDAEAVRSMMKDRAERLTVALVPGGMQSPLVHELGMLSADRMPNLYLLRPDGSVAWSVSGIEYTAYREPDYAMSLAIGTNIEKVRSDRGFEALEAGDYKKALALFATFEPADRRADYWAASRLHGRALAQMGMKNWSAALAEVDAAIERRMKDFGGGMCRCHGQVEMLLTRATILEALGRDREAQAAVAKARGEDLPHAKLPPGLARQGVPIGAYYDWLKEIRIGLMARLEASADTRAGAK